MIGHPYLLTTTGMYCKSKYLVHACGLYDNYIRTSAQPRPLPPSLSSPKPTRALCILLQPRICVRTYMQRRRRSINHSWKHERDSITFVQTVFDDSVLKSQDRLPLIDVSHR
ncbi:uncharacterized protein L3040_007978 [Drepanopeziza brunnea f. sp. 'multigermtubi']|uniref:uncharacterized protein n=1 Tax=Drepanopeziza brunnea f. sp. 'multigermtubi' TaxID=698441 RepID=UPI002382AB78|nr:hypothetical protein L3040_007978 [Drepanopeziza brunnea f. sp. 'multigermtubi']